MKILSVIISASLISVPALAIQLKDSQFELPKIKYSELKKMGMNDKEELKTKTSIRKLLKDPNIAESLRSPYDVDTRTRSMVQEIDLESMGWDVRLYKNKARMALYNFIKKNWEEISRTTINNSGSSEFKNFGPLLSLDLRDNLLVHAASRNAIVFDVNWARIKVYKNKQIAQIVVQQDYLGDRNELSDEAYSVTADESTSKLKKSSKTSSRSSGFSGGAENDLFGEPKRQKQQLFEF